MGSMDTVVSCFIVDYLWCSDTATTDISGDYMWSEMDIKLNIKLEGKMAGIFVQLVPKVHKKYLICKKVKAVLYYELSKALYGTLLASGMFWGKLGFFLRLGIYYQSIQYICSEQ